MSDSYLSLKRRDLLKLIVIGFAAPMPKTTYAKGAVGSNSDSMGTSFRITSPDQFIDIRLELENIVLSRRWLSKEIFLRSKDPEFPSRLKLIFPPQHIAEEVFSEDAEFNVDRLPESPGRVKARLSKESQLVFTVKLENQLAATLDNIVGLKTDKIEYEAYLDGSVTAQDEHEEPDSEKSIIVLPSRIHLATSVGSKWDSNFRHHPHQRTLDAELWQLALSQEDSLTGGYVSPVWTDDFKFGTGNPFGFPSTLSTQDRKDIVGTFSGFKHDCSSGERVFASHLALTSMGGWADLEGKVDRPNVGCDLKSWEHQVSYGQDQWVKVDRQGVLYPTGHEAVLVKMAERKFRYGRKGQPLEPYLIQKQYIVVLPPRSIQSDSLKFPFVNTEILLNATPALDTELDPTTNEYIPSGRLDGFGFNVFFPKVNNAKFRFPMMLRDKELVSHQSDVSLLFVSLKAVNSDNEIDPRFLSAIDSAWLSDANRDGRTMKFSKRSIAISSTGSSGDTSVDVNWMELARDGKIDETPCSPQVSVLSTVLSSAEKIAGFSEELLLTFEKNGVVADPSQSGLEIFAYCLDPKSINFASLGSQSVGAIATPNVKIESLSRKYGPISFSESAAVKTQNQKPLLNDFFDSDAKILGGIAIQDILKAATSFSEESAPSLVQKFNFSVPDFPNFPSANPLASFEPGPFYGLLSADELENRYSWSTDQLESFGPFLADDGCKLSLAGEIVIDLGDGSVIAKSEAILEKFAVCLPSYDSSWIQVNFDSIEFSVDTSSKSEFSPYIRDVEFGGPLSFVSELKKWLGGLGDKDSGLDVAVGAKGLTVSYGFSIPDISFAAFSLSNISLNYAAFLPFDGKPLNLAFAFGKRQSPFMLTVSGYTGAGYFEIVGDTTGPKELRLALEYGGRIGVNFGNIAKGHVLVMAGIYLRLAGDCSLLQGYVRCSGHLSVLKIGSISQVIFIGLSYIPSSNSAFGETRVTIKVKFGFVTIKQSFYAKKYFSGSAEKNAGCNAGTLNSPAGIAFLLAQDDDVDGRFKNSVSIEQWEEYERAFREI